jgi:hypothetical protein
MDIIDIRHKKLGKYYLLFININARFVYIYPLRGKDDASICHLLFNFWKEVEEINSLIAHGERGFISKKVLNFCKDNNIKTYFVKADY